MHFVDQIWTLQYRLSIPSNSVYSCHLLLLPICVDSETCFIIYSGTTSKVALGPECIARNIGFMFSITAIRCLPADFKHPVFQQMHLVPFIHVLWIFVQRKNLWMLDSAFVPLHHMYFGTVAGVHVTSHFYPENGGTICLRNVRIAARVLEKMQDRNQHQHWTEIYGCALRFTFSFGKATLPHMSSSSHIFVQVCLHCLIYTLIISVPE